MTDAKIEELKQEIARQLLPNCGTTVASCELALKAIGYAETLTAQLSAIRDAGDKEVDALAADFTVEECDQPCLTTWMQRNKKLRDIAIARGRQLREAQSETERLKKKQEHKSQQVEAQVSLVSEMQSRIDSLTAERDEARGESERLKRSYGSLESQWLHEKENVEWQKQKVRNLRIAADAAGRTISDSNEYANERFTNDMAKINQRDAEIKLLISRNEELRDLLTSARAIAERKGADTAWERFSQRLADAGIGSMTAKVFKVLPSDLEVNNGE